MTFGEKVLELRKAMGFSQQELAERMGESSAKVISNWEKNLNKPDVEKVSRLCTELRCPASYFIDDGQKLDVTDEEMIFVQKMRGLDDLGKSVVICNLESQYNRCACLGIESKAEKPSDEGSVFLTKKSDEYNEMKKKCRELEKLKKESHLSESDIRLLLVCDEGYDGKISIADLIMLFRGMKVPSLELYNDVYKILTNRIKQLGKEN